MQGRLHGFMTRVAAAKVPAFGRLVFGLSDTVALLKFLILEREPILLR